MFVFFNLLLSFYVIEGMSECNHFSFFFGWPFLSFFLSFFPIINIIIILLYRGRIFFIFISSSFFRATHHKQADHGVNILES